MNTVTAGHFPRRLPPPPHITDHFLGRIVVASWSSQPFCLSSSFAVDGACLKAKLRALLTLSNAILMTPSQIDTFISPFYNYLTLGQRVSGDRVGPQMQIRVHKNKI